MNLLLVKLFLAMTGAASVLLPYTSLGDAATDKANLCQGAGLACGADDKPAANLSNKIGNLTETLLIVAGAVAVIVIIIGGIRYATSTGDSTRIKAAKDTVFYAVIGLIVVIMAYAIVSFVTNNL